MLHGWRGVEWVEGLATSLAISVKNLFPPSWAHADLLPGQPPHPHRCPPQTLTYKSPIIILQLFEPLS